LATQRDESDALVRRTCEARVPLSWGGARLGRGASGEGMRGTTLVAVILIVIAVIALAFQVTYTTHRNIIDFGPIQATTVEHHTLWLPPIVGIVALIGGIGLLVFGKRTG